MVHFNSLNKNSLAIKKAFMSGMDIGEGERAVKFKEEEDSSTTFQSPNVHLLSFPLPPTEEVIVTSPSTIATPNIFSLCIWNDCPCNS